MTNHEIAWKIVTRSEDREQSPPQWFVDEMVRRVSGGNREVKKMLRKRWGVECSSR